MNRCCNAAKYKTVTPFSVWNPTNSSVNLSSLEALLSLLSHGLNCPSRINNIHVEMLENFYRVRRILSMRPGKYYYMLTLPRWSREPVLRGSGFFARRTNDRLEKHPFLHSPTFLTLRGYSLAEPDCFLPLNCGPPTKLLVHSIHARVGLSRNCLFISQTLSCLSDKRESVQNEESFFSASLP